MATQTEKWANLGTETTLMTGANLNALANNALFLSADYNNVIGGGGGDGFTLCMLKATFKFQSAPTSNTALSFWFLKSTDGGSTYEDGSTSVTPARAPDMTFPVSADTNAHIINRICIMPPGHFKGLLKSDGTGQTLTANNTDNTLTITPVTRSSV